MKNRFKDFIKFPWFRMFRLAILNSDGLRQAVKNIGLVFRMFANGKTEKPAKVIKPMPPSEVVDGEQGMMYTGDKLDISVYDSATIDDVLSAIIQNIANETMVHAAYTKIWNAAGHQCTLDEIAFIDWLCYGWREVGEMLLNRRFADINWTEYGVYMMLITLDSPKIRRVIKKTAGGFDNLVEGTGCPTFDYYRDNFGKRLKIEKS